MEVFNRVKLNDLEKHVKTACIDYLNLKHLPNWKHINIPSRKYYTNNVKKGVADHFAVLPPCGTILAIEFKKRIGGKQSEEQKEFENGIKAVGGYYLLVNDVNMLIKFIEAFLKGEK